STRTRRWARASAWRRKWRTAPARTCRRRRRRPDREALRRLSSAHKKSRRGGIFFVLDAEIESVAGVGHGRSLDFITLTGEHAAGAIETTLPVAAVHVFDADLGAGAGRVDELAFADVDADVAEGAAHG